ncbi:MAG: sigma 54-interacting transcriptional regulator [Candidatus Aureabacteria bacterium]|nr:sigma 54-interacting transcriptional regulator [Candidatus Auribacterota bacterium]
MTKKLDINCIQKSDLLKLIETGEIINSSLNLPEVLEKVLQTACSVLDSEASSVILLEQNSNYLVFKTATGEKAEEIKNVRMKTGQGIAGWVINNEKPTISNNVEDDKRWFREISRIINYPTRSIICAPVQVRQKIIGAIEVINKKTGEFSTKDLSLLMLFSNQAAIAIENAKLHKEAGLEIKNLKSQITKPFKIIGSSPQIQKLFDLIETVSKTESTVLMRGESGTGKELASRLIHSKSMRNGYPFTCINCSALPETLLESELFGHEKGSFTGAIARKPGRFEISNKGTVFLDEIGTLSQQIQVKLLRVLQEGEFERVGGTETIKADVRIIAATNENLEKAISEGRFREDLYYRLKVIEIFIPPLRDRKEDIPELVKYFIEEQKKAMGKVISSIEPKAIELLISYEWPGNIRELKNTIERAMVLGKSDVLRAEDLPSEIKSRSIPAISEFSLKSAEKNHIEKVLRYSHHNKSNAARLLGISRNRLDRKIKEYKMAT